MTTLQNERKKADMTQDELAERSGVSQAVISDIESGNTKNPRFETIRKLASVLHFDIADLEINTNKAEQAR